MKKGIIEENRRCSQYGKIENQIKIVFNRSGTQRCKCKECGIRYTLNPQKQEYSKETKELAMKLFY